MIYWIVDTAGGDWPEYARTYGNLETAIVDIAIQYPGGLPDDITIDCIDSSVGGNPDTTAVSVDGFTDNGYTLTIQAHKSQRHGGVWDDSYYRLVVGGSVNSLHVITTNVVIDGLQLKNSHDISGASAIFCDWLSYATIKNCIATVTNDAWDGWSNGPSGIKAYHSTITNCIGVSYNVGNSYAINIGAGCTVLKCTAYADNSLKHAFYFASSSGGNCDNVIAINGGIGDDYGYTSQGSEIADHNVSSDLTAPGTNTVHSFDHSTLFPSAATGDFRPSISYVSAFGDLGWGAGAIPWQRSITVNTDTGGDYDSLNAAEAGEQIIGDDLALRNEKMVISCTSGGTTTADTTAVDIDANWNTSEACDFTVQGEADGVNAYELATNSSSATLGISALYVKIYNISMNNAGTGHCITSNIGDYVSIDGVTIDNAGNFGIYLGEGTVSNCVIGNCQEAIIPWYSDYGVLINNNTIYNCSDNGIRTEGCDETTKFTNNIFINNTIDVVVSGGTPAFLTNISSDGTAPDNATSYTVYYEDTDTLPVVPEDCVIFKSATDFRLVSHFVEDYTGTMVETNSAIGNGTWLYDVADDNAGKSREPYDFKDVRTARDFDIGAWQAPAQLTYVVDTDGVSGDYSNLETAFAALQTDCKADLVVENMLPTISCQASTGVADDTAVNLSGITTSSDAYLTVEGDWAGSKLDTNKYTLEGVTWDVLVLDIGMAYTNIEFLQVVIKNYLSNIEITADNVTLNDNIFVHDAAHVMRMIYSNGNVNLILTNNIVWAKQIALDGLFLGGYSKVYNNTIFGNFSVGCLFPSEIASYNIAYNTGAGDTFYGNTFGWDNSSTNNVSSDLGAATGNLGEGITGLTSDYFTDAANGDFTPVASAGDLMSYGADGNSTETVGAIPYVWEGAVDGVDYGSLAAWDVDAVSEAVSGETVRANCSEIEDTDAVTLTAYPAGVSIEIIGDNDTGVWDDSKYRLQIATNTDGCTIQSSALMHKIQIDMQAGKKALLISAKSSITACLLKQTANFSDWDSGIAFGVGADNSTCINNIVYGFSYADSTVAGINIGVGISGILINNNSVSACYIGILSNSVLENNINNNIAANNTTDFVGTFGGVASNNVSSDATAPGTSPTINQDFTGDFVSATDFHTTDSPYELWGADAAYAGAFGNEPYEVGILVDTDAVTVSPISGVNHPSLSNAVSWFQTNRADLVTRNEKALINCQASTDAEDASGGFEINSLITGVNNKLKIYVAPANRPDFNFTTGYRLVKNTEWGRVISIDNSARHIEFNGLGIEGTQNNNERAFYITPDAGFILTIQNCIIKMPLGGNDTMAFTSDGIVYFNNNIMYGGDGGFELPWNNTVTSYVYNNTAFEQSHISFCTSSTLPTYSDIRNNIAISSLNTTCYALGGSDTHSNNISSDGTGDITDTALNLFVDAAGGDFRLADTATNAIGGGVDLSHIFTTDITGATR